MSEGTGTEKELMNNGWPWPLAKAAFDTFVYAVGLRNGTVIEFEEVEASEDRKWATLKGDNVKIIHPGNRSRQEAVNEVVSNFERGLVIRVADVVWAVDAPRGS